MSFLKPKFGSGVYRFRGLKVKNTKAVTPVKAGVYFSFN
jgi:hypothetical protein